MTRAIFRRHKDAIEMRVQGHAGFAAAGKDPVCAGASVLAMTTAQCIEVMHTEGWLQKKPTVNVSGGNVRVVAKPKQEYAAAVWQAFWQAEVGFALLETAYPDSVQLTSFDSGHNEPDQ